MNLNKKRKSNPMKPHFSTANSSIVTRRGFSLRAGSQKLSCDRRVGVTINSTNHRVSDRSRD